eukprot:1656794-Amphidinium_carterae.1
MREYLLGVAACTQPFEFNRATTHQLVSDLLGNLQPCYISCIVASRVACSSLVLQQQIASTKAATLLEVSLAHCHRYV